MNLDKVEKFGVDVMALASAQELTIGEMVLALSVLIKATAQTAEELNTVGGNA